MRTVVDCVSSELYSSLINNQQSMKLFWEEKMLQVKLIITFDKKDCFHLMGLQDYIYYTTD